MSDEVLARVGLAFRPLVMVAADVDARSAVFRWTEAGLTARIVRGRKMRRRSGLFDEFAAAFQFPLYFGENEAAFDDCLTDLEWLPPGGGYVVVITEPDEVLGDEHLSVLQWFAGALSRASASWAAPVEDGEWWDRPPVPFHVVLAGSSLSVSRARVRWSRVGADLLSYPAADEVP